MWEFTIKINTPENTQIEFELAGIGNRFAAILVDYIILFLLNAIIMLIVAVVSTIISQVSGPIDETINAIIYAGFFFLNFNGYFILFEFLWSGQTPGKRLMGIRVIRDNGQPVGFMEVFIRNIIRIIDLIIGPYFVLFTKEEKRLGDLAIGTIVVKEKDVTVPIVEMTVPEGFKAEIPNISRLTPKDFTLIGNFLKRKDNFESSARENLLNEFLSFYVDKLALQNVCDIKNVKDLSSEEKLRWMYDIYYAYIVRGNITTELEANK